VLAQRYLSGPGVVNGAVVDQLLARTSSGGTTAWYFTDKLGSVRDIVSASGTELDHIVYDSFGNIVTETDAANGDRFKYAGMEYDPVPGLYFDRARTFGAVIGRFLSLDPMGFRARDPNLYRYVGNAPTNGTDPTGKQQPNGDQMQMTQAMQSEGGRIQAQKAENNRAAGQLRQQGDGQGELAGAAVTENNNPAARECEEIQNEIGALGTKMPTLKMNLALVNANLGFWAFAAVVFTTSVFFGVEIIKRPDLSPQARLVGEIVVVVDIVIALYCWIRTLSLLSEQSQILSEMSDTQMRINALQAELKQKGC
jgi:RHS repeat-associated protein